MGIEYLKGKHFNGSEGLKEMKPISANDKSGAQLHVLFMKDCGAGGWALVGDLCDSFDYDYQGPWNERAGLSINCHAGYESPLGMSQIVSHEIGHNLGRENFVICSYSLQYRLNRLHQ